ncbi:MAG: DEAD-like helicases superfamily, partial [Marteilia pararefringens]
MSRCDANSQYLHQEPQDSPQSDAELHLYPVKLQAILNPSTLYVRLLIEEQLPCNERVLMLQSIGEMQRRLNELCDNDINYATNENHMAETRKLIGKLNKNSFCAVLHQDKWHRGIIIDIISYSKKLSYKILLIDHGKLIFSDPSKLRDLAAPFRDSFILIKQLIIDKIQPLLLSNSSLQASQGSSDEDWRVNKNLWSIASVKYLKEFIKDKELYVSIDKEIDQSIYGDLYYENKNEVKGNSHHARIFESFSKCLIKNNFAKSKYISRDLQPPILCNSILSKPLNPAIFPPQKDIDLPKKSNGYVEQQNNSKLGLNGEFFDMGNYFENLMNDSAANNQEINSYDSWHMNIDDPPSQPRRATSSAELENYSIIDTALISNVRRLNSTNLEFKSFKYLPHIDNFIAKYLRTKYPTLCQMYFDLLVKKHKDFLIVSPRQSGKTTIYQLHIVNDLLETIHRDSLSNRSLSLNQKVKALIVCDSWITCFECVESNRLLLSSFQNQIHLQSLSNINHPIESLEITMYNGVDILYLTPKMLLHLYSLNLLRFDELRYLIFENSDIIFNQFGNEIKELYQKMRVKNNRFQTILLSKSFDPGMSKFYHSLSKTNNFSETIISNSEKFAYTQIEIVIKYANVNSYANIVLNSIAPLIQDHSSYITIVSHINILLENLEKFFNEKEIHAERIDCKSLDYDVECKLSRIFNKLPNQSRPTILLLNDHHIHKIGHNDSNMIISIGLPDSKNEWSDRIELGFDHLSKSLKQSDSQANNLRFIQIIMDTDNSRHIQQLLHLFKRCNVSKDSSDLQILYSQLISENSTNSNFDICRYYNQFGRCPNENVCAIRHTFKLTDFEHSFTIHSANRESPSLQINEGNIANLVQNLSDKYSLLNCDFLKVSARVIYCQSPSVLFISIKSIEMPDDKKTTDGTPLTSEEINKDVTPKKYDFRHASFSLDSKMSKFFAVPDNRKLLNDISCVNINLLYALFNDKTSTYHRVKILKIPADVNYFKQQKCILVQFVDDGYKDYVAQISLFYLPSHLAQIEPLAIELVLCNIQPVDRSFEWPPSIAEKTSKLLKNSEIEFVPELITKQTIFTASFRMSSNYSHMNRPMLNLEFPMHFFDNNMALPSPDHINTLLEQKNSLKNIIETEGIEMLQVPPEYMAEPAS